MKILLTISVVFSIAYNIFGDDWKTTAKASNASYTIAQSSGIVK
jgi:hypothetical protein